MAKKKKDLKDALPQLLKACKKNIPNHDSTLIEKAFAFCIEKHDGQMRLSGEPFHNHPIAAALILATEIKLDDYSVVAALLSHIVRKTETTLEDIKDKFGSTITVIVEGLHKISKIETSRADKITQLENYRKLLLSLFKDVRIILVKLSLRLNNMRTAQYLPLEDRVLIAHETMEVYTPYANRFGLRNIKWELEDLSFKFIDPINYDSIKSKLKATRQEREKYVKDFIKPIENKLANDKRLQGFGLKHRIEGRAKHIFSIHNKTIARKKPMEELYDLEAVRIVLDCDDPIMCFYYYGIAASIYPPVPETFKDYISAPKKNGYRSIHTALLGPKNKPVELQIRTESMHEIAEYGVAAHFEYKRGLVPATSVMESDSAQQWLNSIRDIFDSEHGESPQVLLESIKKNVFLEEIHVFSPKNEMMTFPAGATPLDMAYAIHMELGDSTIGAKINGQIVPLDTKLSSGDMVEIITSKKGRPEKEWLKMTITPKAKSGIRKYLRRMKKQAMSRGLDIITKLLSENRIRLRTNEFAKLLHALGFSKREELYLALGRNEIKPSRIIATLINNQTISPEMSLQIKNSIQAAEKTEDLSERSEQKDGYDKNDHILKADFKLVAKYRNNLIEDLGNRIVNVSGLGIMTISYKHVEDKVEIELGLQLSEPEMLDYLLREMHSTRGMISVEETGQFELEE
jgi:GTP pyrophosphokinase